jgi:hypothetical protein
MDTDGQLTFEDDAATIGYKLGFQLLDRRDFRSALKVFKDLEDRRGGKPELKQIITAVEFWEKEYYGKPDAPPGAEDERIRFLKDRWAKFEKKYNSANLGVPEIRDLIKKTAFSEVRDLLLERFRGSNVPDIDLLIDLARCLLELKENDKALETLSYANRLQPNNVAVLSVLSDACWHTGDAGRSKILLREVFLLDADRVPVDQLTSRPAKDMVHAADAAGYVRDRLRWMPVVAVCVNILDVKRELTREEFSDLEIQCHSLEEDMKKDRRQAESLKPLLIYRYFYLIDSLLVSGHLNDPRLMVFENRLKSLDAGVHKAYVNRVMVRGE